MVGFLLKLRWLAVVVALVSGVHSVAFVAMGVLRGIEGYRLILQGPPWAGEQTPGIHLAKSVDAFLLAMVFFVFSIGITTLFVARPGSAALESIPDWMRVRSLSELKFLIWEAILAALVVASVEGFIMSAHEITWTALVLPIAILVLAAGLFLARKAH
jgi:uncharacterized membrane protein YqhA